MRIFGTTGSIEVPSLRHWQHENEEGHWGTTIYAMAGDATATFDGETALTAQLHNIVDVIKGDATPLVSGKMGCKVYEWWRPFIALLKGEQQSQFQRIYFKGDYLMSKPTIGFIGLGLMGRAMCEHIDAVWIYVHFIYDDVELFGLPSIARRMDDYRGGRNNICWPCDLVQGATPRQAIGHTEIKEKEQIFCRVELTKVTKRVRIIYNITRGRDQANCLTPKEQPPRKLSGITNRM